MSILQKKSIHVESPLALAVVCLAFVMLGVGLPMATNVMLLMAAVALTVSGRVLPSLNVRFIAITFWLVAALLAHQLVMLYQNIVFFSLALKFIFFGWLCYGIGYWSVSSIEDQEGVRLVTILVALATGFVCWVFACAVHDGFPIRSLHLTKVTDLYNGELKHKTYVGMASSLGMCLAPLALLGKERSTQHNALRYWSLALLVFGFASNMALQNRTPVLALTVSFAIASIIWLRNWSGRISLGGAAAFFIGMPVLVGTLFIGVTKSSAFLGEFVFTQFQRGGMDTPRYLLWQTVLSHFFDYFWGGRRIVLIESFAHDFWLDVLWDAGIPAFVLWLSFHVYHIYMFTVLVARSNNMAARCALIGIGVSFLLSFMVEPVATASGYYVWACLIFLGIVSRLYSTQKLEKG